MKLLLTGTKEEGVDISGFHALQLNGTTAFIDPSADFGMGSTSAAMIRVVCRFESLDDVAEHNITFQYYLDGLVGDHYGPQHEVGPIPLGQTRGYVVSEPIMIHGGIAGWTDKIVVQIQSDNGDDDGVDVTAYVICDSTAADTLGYVDVGYFNGNACEIEGTVPQVDVKSFEGNAVEIEGTVPKVDVTTVGGVSPPAAPTNWSDLVIDADGNANANVDEWLGTEPAALADTDKVQVSVQHMADIDLSDTQKASVNAEVDDALDTAIPGSPTADSINERVKAIDTKLPSKTYLMGSADSDGGFDTEAKADLATSLTDINLDHLLKNAVDKDTEITNNSAIAQIMASDGDASGFDASTDSLQGIVDTSVPASLLSALGSYGLTSFAKAWTVSDATPTTTSFGTTDTNANDDYCVGQVLIWQSGTANAGQCHVITSFTADGNIYTIFPAAKTTPVNGNGFVVMRAVASNASLALGGDEVTYTVREDDEDTGDVMAGVTVWISQDSAGSKVIWSGVTDSNGVLVASADGSTKPRLAAGTYYFWRKKAGYIFTNPDSETFS